MKEEWQNKWQYSELHVYQCGSEDCPSGHVYGPAVRDHFLIHFIRSGKGEFEVGKKIYKLSAGDGFLICPDQVTTYRADKKDPWFYSWIGFHGAKAEMYLAEANLSAANPIFHYDVDDFVKHCFEEMDSAYLLKKGKDVKRLAYLYLFLYRLIEINPHDIYYNKSESRKKQYLYEVTRYIETNYSRKIRIDDIANRIGLNRSYLNAIFKSFHNMSIQEYLIDYRIRKATELMLKEYLTIGDISRSVGYEDPQLFSKIFKKAKGVTPRMYREKLRMEL